MKTTYIFFFSILAFVFNSCYTTSEIGNFQESKYLDSLKNYRMDLPNYEKSQDTIFMGNFKKLELQNKIISMEDKLVGYHLIKAGDNYRSALLISTLGTISSAILTGVTYDKDKKKVSFVAFLPVIGGAIGAIINIVSASEHLSEAGMVKIKK